MMLLVSVPYLPPLLGPPENAVFTGLWYDTQDFETYLFKMRRPAELGGWLWENWYDPGFSGPGAPLFLFYAALGKLAKVLDADYVLAYHLARVLLAWGEAALLVLLARRLGFRRPWLCLLAMACGGLEWVFPEPDFSRGVLGAEVYLSYSALAFPHFVGAQAAVVASFLGLAEGRLRGRLAAAVALAFLALVHPHLLLPAALAEAAFLLIARRPLREAAASMLVFLPATALGGWLALQIASRPWLQPWASNPVPPPDPVKFAIVLSVPAGLAAFGFAFWARKTDSKVWVRAAAWALAPLFLTFAPLPPGLPDHRARFLEAFAPWLWVFAAYGWGVVAGRKKAGAMAVLALAAMLTGPFRFASQGFFLSAENYAAFYPREVQAAFLWLRENAPGSRVLARAVDALRLPSRALCRPVLRGHWAETPDYERGRAAALEFFAEGTPAERRREILGKTGADFFLWREPFPPGDLGPDWRPVWQEGLTQIWERFDRSLGLTYDFTAKEVRNRVRRD
jgi:hypothetical protein